MSDKYQATAKVSMVYLADDKADAETFTKFVCDLLENIIKNGEKGVEGDSTKALPEVRVTCSDVSSYLEVVDTKIDEEDEITVVFDEIV